MTNNLGNVLIRSDLNVPISNGKITDNFRIKQALSSIEQLKNIGLGSAVWAARCYRDDYT